MTKKDAVGLGLRGNLAGTDLLGFRVQTAPTRTSTSKVGKEDTNGIEEEKDQARSERYRVTG